MTMQRRVVTVLAVLLLAGCAVLRTPAPLTTLQLLPESSPLVWPEGLGLGRVESVAALQGERVVVVDAGLVMQHRDLRWTAPPPVLLHERLRAARATVTVDDAATATPTPVNPPVATLDLWLSRFELRLVAGGGREAVVSAAAELRCRGERHATAIGVVEAVETLADEDPRALAAGFSRGSDQVLGQLIEAASRQLAACASAPPR